MGQKNKSMHEAIKSETKMKISASSKVKVKNTTIRVLDSFIQFYLWCILHQFIYVCGFLGISLAYTVFSLSFSVSYSDDRKHSFHFIYLFLLFFFPYIDLMLILISFSFLIPYMNVKICVLNCCVCVNQRPLFISTHTHRLGFIVFFCMF